MLIQEDVDKGFRDEFKFKNSVSVGALRFLCIFVENATKLNNDKELNNAYGSKYLLDLDDNVYQNFGNLIKQL
jgi:hypothetical protein